MTAPVDVLAVLDRYWRQNDLSEDLYLARAAVAELIEAISQYRNHYRSDKCPAPDCRLCKRSDAASRRLRAALASVGGAP